MATNLQDEMLAQQREATLLARAHALAREYASGVGERRPFPSRDALAALADFREPLPEHPVAGERILDRLASHGAPATVASTGGRYFGFVTGGVVPAAMAAKSLADAWDQSAALYATSPLGAELEAVCEGWLVDLLGLPAGTAAGFVTGTTTATLCGLAAGRDELLRRAGWNAHADGLFGAPPLRVVTGEQAHASVYKAIAVLGLGAARVERVTCDDQGRIVAAKLPPLDARTLVVAQAGNVASGSFDPLAAICAAARDAGAWVHVDGAFGLWAAASSRHRSLVAGHALADSWSADAHKTLNAPYDSGIVFVRERAALVAAMQMRAAYLVASSVERDPMHLTLDMSRRARGIELWATLMALGRSGVESLVEGLCRRATQLADGLAKEGFRILNEVVFNQVLVACDTPEQTRATLAAVQAGGECWCGGTDWKGEPAARVSVCSWATTEADIERTVRAFVIARGAR